MPFAGGISFPGFGGGGITTPDDEAEGSELGGAAGGGGMVGPRAGLIDAAGGHGRCC